QKPTLLINNSERIRSVTGALLTLVVWGLTLMMSIFILQDFYLSSFPSVVKSSSDNLDLFTSYDINKLPISFNFFNKSTQQVVNTSFFTFSLYNVTQFRSYDKHGKLNSYKETSKPLEYS